MLENFFTLIYIYLFVISDFIVFEIYRIQYILIKKQDDRMLNVLQFFSSFSLSKN